ncbi:MAG: hypothetical protein WB919_09675 [Candidatus Sulfotelmatobacter sp.]
MPKKNKEEKRHGFSRRTFGQKAGLAGVAAILGTGTASAVPSAALAQDSASKSSGDIRSAELEAKYQHVMLQYGDRLSAEQQTYIRKILASNEKMMELIREFHLENGQGTATTLKLYPDPAVLLARTTGKN